MKLFIISILTLLFSLNILGQAKKIKYPNNWYLTTNVAISQPYGSLWYIHNKEVKHENNPHSHKHDEVIPKKLPTIKKTIETAGNSIQVSLGLLNKEATKVATVELIAFDKNNKEIGRKEVMLSSGSKLSLSETKLTFKNTSYQEITIVIQPKSLNKADELYVNLINV